MVFCTHIYLGTFTCITCSPVDILTCLVSSNKTDSSDVWMSANICHSLSSSLNNINDSIRNSRLFEQRILQEYIEQLVQSFERLKVFLVSEQLVISRCYSPLNFEGFVLLTELKSHFFYIFGVVNHLLWCY